MPNIEIHGFLDYLGGETGPSNMSRAAFQLRDSIFRVLANEPFIADVVVNVVASITTDCDRKRQPFLRVYSTPGPDINRVMEILDENFDMDIEGPIDIKFQPRKSARKTEIIAKSH